MSLGSRPPIGYACCCCRCRLSRWFDAKRVARSRWDGCWTDVLSVINNPNVSDVSDIQHIGIGYQDGIGCIGYICSIILNRFISTRTHHTRDATRLSTWSVIRVNSFSKTSYIYIYQTFRTVLWRLPEYRESSLEEFSLALRSQGLPSSVPCHVNLPAWIIACYNRTR